jgi:phosphoglycolate phosphatase-like HAD superfamily hydrolase
MVEILQAALPDADPRDFSALAHDLIERTTGKATVLQMADLAEMLSQRGGTPGEPQAYKDHYVERLTEHIEARRADLTSGRVSAEALLVPGVSQMLAALQAHKVTSYLASGSDHQAVVEEIEWLGLAHYFEDRIYGARTDENYRSKGQVIAQIKQQYDLKGPELVVLGDGAVEIEEAEAAGAIGVGVASNEAERRGIDPKKRARLIAVGADLIVPDFSQADALINYLFPPTK